MGDMLLGLSRKNVGESKIGRIGHRHHEISNGFLLAFQDTASRKGGDNFFLIT
jgi:hypothetical protein